MDNAYSHLGKVFESLNADADYPAWTEFILRTLQGYPHLTSGVDIGCGNGAFTRSLAKAGYDMLGADISPAMLQKAEELSRKEGTPCKYILADVTKLSLPHKLDFAVSVNDCLNYVPPEKLATALKRVRSSLKKGGIFLFDISSEYKLRHKVGNNLFCDDAEDATCIWFTALHENVLTLDVTLFLKQSDGSYVRADERHTQYIHTEQEVLSALEKSGFSVLSVTGHLGEDKAQSDRLNFLAVVR